MSIPKNEIAYVVYYDGEPISRPYATTGPAKSFITYRLRQPRMVREQLPSGRYTWVRLEWTEEDKAKFQIVEYTPTKKTPFNMFEF